MQELTLNQHVVLGRCLCQIRLHSGAALFTWPLLCRSAAVTLLSSWGVLGAHAWEALGP